MGFHALLAYLDYFLAYNTKQTNLPTERFTMPGVTNEKHGFHDSLIAHVTQNMHNPS